MKELALKRRLNTYLYKGSPQIFSNIEISVKQLEAQLKNGVAYKKKRVLRIRIDIFGLVRFRSNGKTLSV